MVMSYVIRDQCVAELLKWSTRHRVKLKSETCAALSSSAICRRSTRRFMLVSERVHALHVVLIEQFRCSHSAPSMYVCVRVH